jgi:NTE family protein
MPRGAGESGATDRERVSDYDEGDETSARDQPPEAARSDGGADVLEGSTNVAIACQGGGSHTAFTAGVLQSLLEHWQPEHELVGLSGTSGGAFNALAAWYGLLSEGPAHAIDLLDALWSDLQAGSLVDLWTSNWLTSMAHMDDLGVPMPQFSPYHVSGTEYGKRKLREALEGHIAFDSFDDLAAPSHPDIVVGTVDVTGGKFETFVNEAVTVDAVLASAAVPRLFEAVEVEGSPHWDGLFSQNPPIDDLFQTSADRKPDELWVIQVNPQRRETVPTGPAEIADRRNELAGNISLNQELRFVQRLNSLIDDGYLPESEFSKTQIRRITMDRRYSAASKMDRRPSLIDDLIEYGHEKAAAFHETE